MANENPLKPKWLSFFVQQFAPSDLATIVALYKLPVLSTPLPSLVLDALISAEKIRIGSDNADVKIILKDLQKPGLSAMFPKYALLFPFIFSPLRSFTV